MLGVLLRQAWILSVLYLLLGVVVSIARKWSDAAIWVNTEHMLDAVAQAILVELRLWPAFVRAIAFGKISPKAGRMVLGTITIVMIHLQALFLGAVFMAIHTLGSLRGRRSPPS